MDIDGIDLSSFYPFVQASKFFPGRASEKKVSWRTLERWRDVGLLRHGVRIKLRTIKLGNHHCTCDEWVKEFVDAMNNVGIASELPQGAATCRTPTKRQRESTEARRRLDHLWGKTEAA